MRQRPWRRAAGLSEPILLGFLPHSFPGAEASSGLAHTQPAWELPGEGAACLLIHAGSLEALPLPGGRFSFAQESPAGQLERSRTETGPNAACVWMGWLVPPSLCG